VVELRLWRYYAQTKRNCHRPWCEDGANALGLGILTPHTMVGAKAAPRHGCGKKRKKIIRKQVLILYVLFVYLPIFGSITLFRREETVFFLFASHPETLHIKTGKGTTRLK
jgi:hypothetical protein